MIHESQNKIDDLLKSKFNFYRGCPWKPFYGQHSHICSGIERTPEGDIPKMVIATNATENSYRFVFYTQDVSDDKYYILGE